MDQRTDETPVTVWFNQAALPRVPVLALLNGNWIKVSSPVDAPADTGVAWDGPLPLFAVERFTVESASVKAHLIAMAGSFRDIGPPRQPVDIFDQSGTKTVRFPKIKVSHRPPEHWNALRGAASMALWSVPSIGPWMRLLCASLSDEGYGKFARELDAPWLQLMPWTQSTASKKASPAPLWTAMLRTMRAPRPDAIRAPQQLLHDVLAQAATLGMPEDEHSRLRESTTLLLEDRGTIQELGTHDNLLWLALQLVLLRPDPERFAAWREDWKSIPPAAWWTGAVAVGHMAGFEALPPNLRGSAEAREVLAVRTWYLSGQPGGADWNALWPEALTYATKPDRVEILVGKRLLYHARFSARGRWHEADLSSPILREEATRIVEQMCPELMRQVLVLETGDYEVYGEVSLGKSKGGRRPLQAKSRLNITADPRVHLEQTFDSASFRHWLATAAISQRLPPLIVGSISTSPASADSTSVVSDAPEGLQLVPDFIDAEAEARLLQAIDASPWDASMTRRVQHYGWRYDYKSRNVSPRDRLGPLPDWAQVLSSRLRELGLVDEVPDQVIVNEYIGAQGIARHIDCPSCFRGAIVTVSLGETWEMIFSRKTQGEEQKHRIVLPRRSAAVLAGPARDTWAHEIPKRKTEGRVRRGRRVSITFRKVDFDA